MNEQITAGGYFLCPNNNINADFMFTYNNNYNELQYKIITLNNSISDFITIEQFHMLDFDIFTKIILINNKPIFQCNDLNKLLEIKKLYYIKTKNNDDNVLQSGDKYDGTTNFGILNNACKVYYNKTNNLKCCGTFNYGQFGDNIFVFMSYDQQIELIVNFKDNKMQDNCCIRFVKLNLIFSYNPPTNLVINTDMGNINEYVYSIAKLVLQEQKFKNIDDILYENSNEYKKLMRFCNFLKIATSLCTFIILYRIITLNVYLSDLARHVDFAYPYGRI